jgi:Glycosyltransferase family 9 (heptosyltransferase)
VIIDCQDNGLGDVVLACWLLQSAWALGSQIQINPRSWSQIPSLFGIGHDAVTQKTRPHWTQTNSIGLLYEYTHGPGSSATRFELWAESLNFPKLKPIRPNYIEANSDGHWADEQWRRIDQKAGQPRIIIFPAAARSTRCWPTCYYIDLAEQLTRMGACVAVLGSKSSDIQGFNCSWWWGFSISKVAAFMKRSDLIIGNDSRPAHLGGTIGIRTVAICGPTDGRIVFGHDTNVLPVSLEPEAMKCTGCHFSPRLGFRDACRIGGCQALMRLTPEKVLSVVAGLLPAAKRK